MTDFERFHVSDTEFEARLDQLVEYCMNSNRINPELYTKYDVKKGPARFQRKGRAHRPYGNLRRSRL